VAKSGFDLVSERLQVADAEMLTIWLRDHVAGEVSGETEPMIERLEAKCHELAIEPISLYTSALSLKFK